MVVNFLVGNETCGDLWIVPFDELDEHLSCVTLDAARNVFQSILLAVVSDIDGREVRARAAHTRLAGACSCIGILLQVNKLRRIE